MKIKDKKQLIAFLQLHKKTIAAFGVKEIGIFGSYVRGNQNKNSDIDVLVEFDPDKLSYNNFIDLSYFLEDNLGKKVDVLTKGGLSPHIGPQILKEVEYVPL